MSPELDLGAKRLLSVPTRVAGRCCNAGTTTLARTVCSSNSDFGASSRIEPRASPGRRSRSLVRTRPLETLPGGLDFGSDHTFFNVIIDQPHRLHEGIDRGRPDKFPALFLQVLRQGNRGRRRRGRLRLRQLLDARFVAPDESSQRPFPLYQFLGLPRIVDDRFDLAAVADNSFVLQKTVDVAPGVAGDLVEIKTT